MKSQRYLLQIISFGIISALLGLSPFAEAKPKKNLTVIKVSYIPALYWSLPFFIATDRDWWTELGLKPEFKTYPGGVPLINGASSKAWDVGGAGSLVSVVGYSKFGVKTIGITNDESQANTIVASKSSAVAFKSNPGLIKGKTILLTNLSTGEFTVSSCLKHYGLSISDVNIKLGTQGEIMNSIASGTAEFGGLWAPNIYTLEERSNTQVICSAKDSGVTVLGALIVRDEYAKQNPENVAKFLAIYLRAWNWMHAHPAEALKMMSQFYDVGGVTVSDKFLVREFDTRPTFNLEKQLTLMDRSKSGTSQMDLWFQEYSDFLKNKKALDVAPSPSEFITDQYMKMIKADKKLVDFVNNTK
jgi:NitT/TauT family transport system substrate-binding protein